MSRHLPALAYRSGPRLTCGPHLLFCVSQRYFSPFIALQNGRDGDKDEEKRYQNHLLFSLSLFSRPAKTTSFRETRSESRLTHLPILGENSLFHLTKGQSYMEKDQ